MKGLALRFALICLLITALGILFPVPILALVLLLFITYLCSIICCTRRSWILSRVLTFYLGSLVALLISESILRICIPLSATAYRPEDALVVTSTNYPRLLRYAPHVNFNGDTIGDLAALSGSTDIAVRRNVNFITDAQGLRNVPESGAKYKYIVLGDSFALGAGTSQSETITSHLISILHADVYNIAFPGSPADSFRNFLIEMQTLPIAEKPTLIWLLFSGNDMTDAYNMSLLEGNQTRLSYFAGLQMSLFNLRIKNRILKLIQQLRLKSVISSREHKVVIKRTRFGTMPFYKKWMMNTRMSKRDIISHPNWKHLEWIVKRISQEVHRYNMNILIVTVPDKNTIYLNNKKRTNGFNEAVCELAISQNLPCIDLSLSFKKASRVRWKRKQELLWWRDDTHWNGAGQRLAASIISKHLNQ